MPNSKKTATPTTPPAKKTATPPPAKTSRKSHRPRIDAIVNAIVRGDYDDKLGDIRRAIDTRNEARRDAVLAQVREVWGEDAEVVTAKAMDAEPRRNPFLDLDKSESFEHEPLDPEAQPTIVSGSRVSQDDGGVVVSEAAGGSDAEMERLGEDHISHSPTFG
jgi:hypothetical protein